MYGKQKDRKEKPISDRELIMKTLKGDNEAFARLIETYYGLYMSVALKYTHEMSLAEDIVQEGLMDIHKSLRSIHNPDRFGSWSYIIMKRQCIRWIRKQKSESRVLSEYTDKEKIEEIKEKAYISPQIDLATEEESRKILNAISELPRSYREIVILHYYNDLTPVDIAKRLRLSIRTVYVRLYRAKDILREKLEGES